MAHAGGMGDGVLLGNGVSVGRDVGTRVDVAGMDVAVTATVAGVGGSGVAWGAQAANRLVSKMQMTILFMVSLLSLVAIL